MAKVLTGRSWCLAVVLLLVVACDTGTNSGGSQADTVSKENSGVKEEDKVDVTQEEWRETLTPEQFRICRGKGTEPPNSGKYLNCKEDGTYVCAACSHPLFSSETKYDSKSGWPSFWAPLEKTAVKYVEDMSFGMKRIEVTCAKCDSHLGHLFDDGPKPTGQRFCVNSISLDLKKK